jgi:hypothetical protein
MMAAKKAAKKRVVKRRRNIPGYKDSAGIFHPLRGGAGYSAQLAGETRSRRPAAGARRFAKATAKYKADEARKAAIRRGVEYQREMRHNPLYAWAKRKFAALKRKNPITRAESELLVRLHALLHAPYSEVNEASILRLRDRLASTENPRRKAGANPKRRARKPAAKRTKPSIRKRGRTATLKNFSGTVKLLAPGRVRIVPTKKR